MPQGRELVAEARRSWLQCGCPMDRLDTAKVIFGKFGNHFLIYPNFGVRLKAASSPVFKDDYTATRDPTAAHRRQLKKE